MSSSALSAAGSSVVRACGRRAGRRVSLVSVAMSTTKTLSTLDKRCCFSSMTASSLTASTSSSSSSSSSSALLPLTRRFATQTAGKSATAATTTFQKYPFLAQLDLSEHNLGAWNGNEWVASGEVMKSINPATGEVIATVQAATAEDYESCIRSMDRAKQQWMAVPTPVRGDLLRKLSAALSKHKDALGALISLEMGKILSEGKGEVQEAIDICDHAAGLSRSLNGQVIPSERRNHMILEQWHPLKGHVGVISAFNFPCAVYFWNLALSLVCGNTNIWKGSESTNLVSIACTKIVNDVVRDAGYDGGLACLVQGTGKEIGARLVADPRVELISFTGSERVGREVAGVVASRFGKQILELGGNNAMVVMDDADLSMCLRSVLFSAVGTAGQRCTTLRRLYLHDSVYDSFVASLTKAYRSIPIGDPMASSTLCGPLHTPSAVDAFVRGVARAQAEGGRVLIGGKALPGPGNFVEPTIIEVPTSAPCVQVELFAPVLYVMRISSLEEGIQLNNDVPQGLSSALFSKSPQNIARWTSAFGSDCGLVNVNLGTSGAEIGGAFGGEKSTGGGRESGSDCWKQYCRRTTSVINNGTEMPLAQGVQFDV